jgi:hypothetical protein
MTRGVLSGFVIVAGVLFAGCGPPADTQKSKSAGPTAGQKKEEELGKFPSSEFPPSLVQLLAHPDRYHGEKLQVKGYLHVQFEGTAIYLSRDDAEYGITRNGFWVQFDKASGPFEDGVKPEQLDKKYVLIEGTFDKNSFGHMGLWAGTIGKVTRAYELRRNR